MFSFTVELDTSGGKMRPKCHGEIVRIAPRDNKVEVALKITESTMEPVKRGQP
jgi:hypothetical protein